MKYITIVLLLITSSLYAQEIKPRGQFLADSIKIGQPVGFSLAVSYPKELDIVFPDSLFNFSPYELTDKQFIPTKTDSSTSYDSAVYYLSSFEIDKIQTLKLPIFILNGADSSLIYTRQDSIYLKELVTEVPDSISAEAAPLKENTRFINVPLQFNYPYFIIGLVVFLVLIILVIIFFGKRIKNAFIVYRLKNKHTKFLTKFDELINHQDANKKQAEKILLHWKKYLEKLEKRPYTQLTTKEIIENYTAKNIAKELKHLDKIIYANIISVNSEEHYDSLKEFAQNQFENKVEEVKNG